MKKIFLRAVVLLLVLSLAISAFASCGETEKQDNDAQSEKEETPSSEKTPDEESEFDESASDDNAIGTEGLEYKLLDDDTYEVWVGTAKGDTEIVIPSKYNGKPVTSIGYFAFYNCMGLTSIDIPDSVTSIGDRAFHGCTGLTSIDIPDSVTSIGKRAFSDCTKLTSIKFRGSEAEWNAIEKGTGWNKNVPSSCQIIFNYTGE